MIFDNDMFNNAMQKLELGELMMTMLWVLLHVEYYPVSTGYHSDVIVME